LAFQNIKANFLRTAITALIIAIGILALVGILSSIDGIKSFLSNSFNRLGSNTFNIKNSNAGLNFGGPNAKRIYYKPISYKEALNFKERFSGEGLISFSSNVAFDAKCKSKYGETNANVFVLGVDENYLSISGYDIKAGRFFTSFEAQAGKSIAIIGSEIAKNLFSFPNPIDSLIKINGIKYKVIGVLKEKGSSLGMGAADRQVFIPVGFARTNFVSDNNSHIIICAALEVEKLDYVMNEAMLTFRQIRNLKSKMPNNFEIAKSDSLATKLIDNLSMVSLAAYIIAIITLFGAGIGLMNIMLVSVTERTKEIGTAKAIGAKSSDIRKQFLIEAIIVCQFGGIIGIILGSFVGFGVAKGLGIAFIMPWNWVIIAFIVCFVIGVFCGAYPAAKAAKLNPIDSLRYE